MTTCTFLCDDPVIDTYFYTRLQQAVLEIAEVHDDINFLFPSETGECMLLCLCAVVEAKMAYPHKRIEITTVANKWRQKRSVDEDWYFPDCIVDHLVVSSSLMACENDRKYIRLRNRIDRWVIDRSDYVICYHYTDLASDNQLYRYAHLSKAKLIDLVQQDTLRFIQNCIPCLTPAQQQLKQQRDCGATLLELANCYSRSTTTIGLRLNKIAHALTGYAKSRVMERSRIDVVSQPVICSLLLDHTAITDEILYHLKQFVGFILQRCNSALFLVDQAIAVSEPVAILSRLIKRHRYAKMKPAHISVFGRPILWSEILAVSDFVIYNTEQQERLITLHQESIALETQNIVPRLKAFNISGPAPHMISIE